MRKLSVFLAAASLAAFTGSTVLAGSGEKCESGSTCCASKAGNTAKAQLQLKGVTCSESAAKAETALLQVKGVKSAHVCPQSHTASVEFDKSVTSARKISSAAKKAGFKVEKRS